ncbi:FAD binding domain-containing protein [Spirochaeta isovalerica]|uniref:Carbon-monoxide dehydrogenase medium subunit n=1 Tax=Spirochaeta isovalerica TaxID=150 RepID=A0A841RA40_9SPIO|nr:xanthine dehydrogenase family protein subunit M [Spirochaeta isovalerica]MBB6479568.1 carbon-monoxide dehydrogenase medium subunit [Spirochaeta isovalerica]
MLNFDYRRPESLVEALSLRKEWGGKSSLLMGGTDLFLAIEEEVRRPELLIDLKKIDELSRLEEKDGSVHIGAAVTYSELIRSDLIHDKLPGIWESSRLVASVGIRNSATMVGNICNAVPSAESAAPLMVRGAMIHIASSSGSRTVPAVDFFTGPRRTVVKDDEIVTSISVPLLKGKFGESYVKLGRYRGEDIAQVATAVLVDEKLNFAIAYGAVGPVPMRIPGAEAVLKGKKPTADLLDKAKAEVLSTVTPIADIRASREYRLHMCAVMFEKAIAAAVSRMETGAPAYGARLI